MTTHEVLVAAKAYLLNHGWLQHSVGVSGGPRCLVGAVADAERQLGVWTHRRADAALFKATGHPTTLGAWNDEPGRTLDEVIDAIDRAILATAPPAPVPEPVTT